MKLKKYLLIALLPVIIGAVLTYYFYLRTEEKAFSLVIDTKRVTLEQVANSITTQFQFIHYDLQDLSQRKAIIDISDDGEKEIDLFYETHSSIFVSITRIDKNGYIAYSTPNQNVIGMYVGDQPHNKEVLEKHIPIVSDVFMAVQGFKTLAFAYPVFKNGKFDGTISILLPISKLADLLLSTTNLSELGHSLLLTKGGIEIYCTFKKEHIGRDIHSAHEGGNLFQKSVHNMLKGNSGLSYYWDIAGPDSNKTKKWIVYKPIPLPNTFWSLGLVTTEAEIYGRLHEVRENLLFIISVSFLAFVAIVLIYIRSSNKAEAELRRRDQKYQIVTKQAGHIVYEYDRETKSVLWSSAVKDVVGYEEDELQNFNAQTWFDRVHPDDKAHFFSVLENARTEGTGYTMQYRIKHKEGNYVYVEESGILDREIGTGKLKYYGTIKNINARKEAEAALLLHKNKLEKLVEERTRKLEEVNKVLERDIKKRKETENELIIAKEKAEASDRLKSEFLAQVSHEIRTPINTILSFSSLIGDELSGKVSDDLKEGFGIMAIAGQRIIRTIDLILNMSELQTKTYDPRKTTFNLIDDILAPLMEEFQIHAGTKKLKLELVTSLEKSKAIIKKDRYSISQIFINLVDNAIKYTLKGGIKINVYLNDDNKLCVEVNDTGIGISEEYLPVLFDSFSQEEQGYSRRFEGTGLGLALVKNYCEINNAEIEVESSKGTGSTFRVIFN